MRTSWMVALCVTGVAGAAGFADPAKGESVPAAPIAWQGLVFVADLTTGKTVFRKPATTVENAAAPLTPQGVRFCPGTQGGAEWNGPAFDPAENMIFTGEVDWCTTVRTVTPEAIKSTPEGKPWSGATEGFGKMDDAAKWSGWLTAFDAASGKQLWSISLGGAVGGGVISYDTGMGQKIAVAAGMTSAIWPTQKTNGKIVVLGL